ncbi:hypothetical protein D3C75_1254240 [compost metagenome]
MKLLPEISAVGHTSNEGNLHLRLGEVQAQHFDSHYNFMDGPVTNRLSQRTARFRSPGDDGCHFTKHPVPLPAVLLKPAAGKPG